MIESIFLKELMLMEQVHENNVIFVTYGILKILVLNMNCIYALVAMI